jgi:hypothetical protein
MTPRYLQEGALRFVSEQLKLPADVVGSRSRNSAIFLNGVILLDMPQHIVVVRRRPRARWLRREHGKFLARAQ